VKVAMGGGRKCPGRQRRHFAYDSQVADDAVQMDVHKTLSCFFTTKKISHESTHSIRIYFEIFFKWSCRLYEFATKVYFQSFLKRLLNWHTIVVIIVNSTQIGLKWTWTISNCVCGSLICAGWTELTCEIFSPNYFLHFGYQKCFCFP